MRGGVSRGCMPKCFGVHVVRRASEISDAWWVGGMNSVAGSGAGYLENTQLRGRVKHGNILYVCACAWCERVRTCGCMRALTCVCECVSVCLGVRICCALLTPREVAVRATDCTPARTGALNSKSTPKTDTRTQEPLRYSRCAPPVSDEGQGKGGTDRGN